MRIRLAILALVLCFAAPAFAQEAAAATDPAKEAAIRRLIAITGGDKMADQMFSMMQTQMMQIIKRSIPAGEQGDRARLMIEVFSAKLKERFEAEPLVNRLIPVYDRHLTTEELEGLIHFYESPLGQRLIQVMPQILQESFTVGSEWGREVVREIFVEMEDQFPELKNVPKP